MSSRARDLLRIHTAVLFFGLAGLFGKLLAFSPFVIVLGRVALAALVLLLATWLWRLPCRPPSRRSLPALAGLGLLLAVHWTTFFQSVQDSSVAVALITFSTFPVFVAFLEPFLFGEKFRTMDVGLALIALAGIVVLTPSFEPGDRATQGVLWGVASGLTFALLSLLNRKYVRQVSSITIALYQDAFAAVVLVPFAIACRPTVITAADVVFMLVLGILCTAVAHSLFIAGLRSIKARTASMIACLEPVYGSALAIFILEEVPSVRTAVGGMIVLAVAFVATINAGRDKENI